MNSRSILDIQLECGPMPNVMAAVPNIGGALCSTPQSLADAQYCRSAVQQRCQDAKAVEICRGVQLTTGSVSTDSGPKFTILWELRVEEILRLNKFFSDCRYMPQLRKCSPTKLCDGAQMAIFGDFLRPVFSASHVQHISDVHSKFALGPRHVQKYGRHPICGR